METEGVAEGCVSRPLKDLSEVHRPKSQQKQREDQYRLDVFHDVLTRLREAGLPESFPPSFEEELWNHFHRLPACYAMDVNVHRAEDVLTHMKLLEQAQDSDKRPAIAVRLLQANPAAEEQNESQESSVHGGENVVFVRKRSLHHPPSLGSLAILEALPIEHNKHHHDKDGDFQLICRPMHEITISTVDKPKLLNLLTSLFAELGLNIKEAHAFSTNDGFSLDVFFVDGWPHEILDNSELYKYRWLTCLNRLAVKESELLEESLQKKFQKNGKDTWSKPRKWTPATENEQSDKSTSPNNVECLPNRVKIPRDGIDEWELDPRLLEFGKKVASGSFGDLYRGSYCSQDVAIKILNPERVHVDLQKEFAQEVFIMRKIRHKNVVQFIGACTKLPSLCIVTEFMSKGSVYDFLHKNGNIFRLPVLVRVATDVAKGMNFLHQNNIIHRDLKSSNLLMDENEIVKVADFGVARVKSPTGVMTAETGTYRWMAPEVIEHLPYDHKADVFSFGVVLWELLTGKLPHEDLTPLQAALGVVQKGLRPKIPEETHPSLSELIKSCWQQNPDQRPDFMEIIKILESISVEVSKENGRKKSSSGFLPFFKRSLHSLG